MKKRILALVLAFLMVLGMIPEKVYVSKADDTEMNVWDTVGAPTEVCLIGFLDKDKENIVFYNNSTAREEVEIATAECPDYLILTQQYANKESGEAVIYQANSADDEFYFGVLSQSPFVEAKYFSAVVEAKGLYATLTGEGIITLYKDLGYATDTVSVSASELAGEYVVAALCYEASLFGWFIKLTANENWPETADGYVWVNCAQLVGLSQTATQVPEEPEKCEICGEADCSTEHKFCDACEDYDCGKIHVFCQKCNKYDCGVDHSNDVPEVSATVTDSEGNAITDSEGNPQTVTVSGEALPEGARLAVNKNVIYNDEYFTEAEYDISLTVDDIECEPSTKVNVTISGLNIYAHNFAKITHYMEDVTAIKNGYEAGTVQVWTDVEIAARYPKSAEATLEALGLENTVCVELFYSSDGVISVSDGVISFYASTFSIYTLEYTSTDSNTGRVYAIYDDDNGTAQNSNGYSEKHEITMDDSNGATYMLTRGQKFYLDIGSSFFVTGMTSYQWYLSSSNLGSLDESGFGTLAGNDTILTVSGSAPHYTHYTIKVIGYNLLGTNKKERTINVYVVPEVQLVFNPNIPSNAASSNVTVPTSRKTVLGDGTSTVPYTRVQVSNPTGTVVGYAFEGWYTAADGGTKVSSGQYIFLDNDNASYVGGTYSDQYQMNLYAHWTPLYKYSLTFNANLGSDTSVVASNMPSASISTDWESSSTKTVLWTQTPTRSGYTFLGWSTNLNATTAEKITSYTLTGVVADTASATLNAIWAYNITYDANGGSGAPSAQSVSVQNDTTLSSTIPTKSDYVFKGWLSSADNKIYQAGDTYSLKKPTKMTAQWSWDVQILNGYDGYLYPAGSEVAGYKWYKQSGTYSYDTTTWSNSWSAVPSSSLSGNNVDVLKDGGYVKENADMVSGTKYQYRLDGLDSQGNVIGTAYYTVNFSDHILNSSFESPHGGDGACKGYAYNHENIFGSSTITGEVHSGLPWDIEIVGSKAPSFGNKVAYHERQYAEINANAASALYQDVLTESDSYLGWALSHTCRLTSGTDTMYVMIASSKTARHVQTQDELDILIDNAKTVYENVSDDQAKAAVFSGETELTAAVDGVSVVYRIWEISSEFNSTTEWTLHSGNYHVPEGQTMTRFFFAAGQTAAMAQGNQNGDTIGNLIDSVAFDDKIYYTVNYYLDGKLLTAYGETGIGDEGATITANETTISVITADNAAVLQSVYLNNTSQGTSNKSMVLEKERANNLSLYFSSNYTLTFDYNGGKSSSDNREFSSHTVTYGSRNFCEVEWLNHAREGYTFDGWYTAKTGGTQMYGINGLCIAGAYWNSSNQWIGSSDMTVYAHWTPYNYSVVFNGNGHTNGSMSNQSFVYDTAQALSDNKFVRQYTVSYVTNGGNVPTTTANTTATATFNGWATSANGDKVYNNKQSVSNLTTTQNGIYNLFAHWTLDSVTLPIPQDRAGYNFLGWYEDVNLTQIVGAAGVEYTPQSNVTLYAKWEQINYTITFKNDNGDVISTKTDYHYGDTVTIPSAPQKQATAQYTYTFAGWTPEVTSVTGDATYTAQFEATEKECTIIYVAGTGGKVSLATETFKVGTGIPSGSIATADTGYKFVGWYDQDNKLVGSEAEFKPAKQSNNLYATATYTAKFELALVDLTITVSGEDANQSYIFTITGTSDDGSSEISLKIVLVGNASKTIRDLPVGTYTIEETANDSKIYCSKNSLCRKSV